MADGSSTAKAIDYSLKRCAEFVRYADSGDLPFDNNPVENAIGRLAARDPGGSFSLVCAE